MAGFEGSRFLPRTRMADSGLEDWDLKKGGSTICPTRFRRTRNLMRTSLFSERISSVTDHDVGRVRLLRTCRADVITSS